MNTRILSFLLLLIVSTASGEMPVYSVTVSTSGEDPFEFEIPDVISNQITLPITVGDLRNHIMTLRFASKDKADRAQGALYISLQKLQSLMNNSNDTSFLTPVFEAGYPLVFNKEILVFRSGNISVTVLLSLKATKGKDRDAAANP